jgi:transcriptional regulator with XRE-family HTH domain
MMTLEQVRQHLKDRRLTVVADRTGLHYQTVWRISAGEAEKPSYEVIKRLSDYLEGTEAHG